MPLTNDTKMFLKQNILNRRKQSLSKGISSDKSKRSSSPVKTLDQQFDYQESHMITPFASLHMDNSDDTAATIPCSSTVELFSIPYNDDDDGDDNDAFFRSEPPHQPDYVYSPDTAQIHRKSFSLPKWPRDSYQSNSFSLLEEDSPQSSKEVIIPQPTEADLQECSNLIPPRQLSTQDSKLLYHLRRASTSTATNQLNTTIPSTKIRDCSYSAGHYDLGSPRLSTTKVSFDYRKALGQQHVQIMTRNLNELERLKANLRFSQQRNGRYEQMVGIAWNQKGNYHFRCREYKEAKAAYKEAANCNEGINGNEHIANNFYPLAAALVNLGTVDCATGHMDQAIEHFQNAMNMHERREEHPQGKSRKNTLAIAACLYQIALAQCLKREYEEAIHVLLRAREIFECVLGPFHSNVARTIDAIAKCHYFLGKLGTAMTLHYEALEIKRQVVLPNDPTIITSLMNIAAVHRACQEYDEAIDKYLVALHSRKSELAQYKINSAENRPGTVRAAMEAAETLQLLKEMYTLKGDNANASRVTNEAVMFYREAGLQDDDPKIRLLV